MARPVLCGKLTLMIICYLVDRCVSVSCGKTLFKSNDGFISSPNYPNNYERNSSCTYKIRVAYGKRVVLTWKLFDVSGYMPHCADHGDGYVEVHTGCGLSNSFSVMKFCSSNMGLPHVIYSRNNCMTIIFRSNSRTARGFQAFYSSSGTKEAVTTALCKSETDLTSSSGVIMSSNWPLPYPKKYKECKWNLKFASSRAIQLNFMDVDTASTTSCLDKGNDYIKIRGKTPKYAGTTGKRKYYCGKHSPFSLDSQYYHLQVGFKVYGRQDPGRGFVLGYVAYTRKGFVPTGYFSAGAIAALVVGPLALILCGIFMWIVYRRTRTYRNPAANTAMRPKKPENEVLFSELDPPSYSTAVRQPNQGYPVHPNQQQPYSYLQGTSVPPLMPCPGDTTYLPPTAYQLSTVTQMGKA